MKAFLAIVLYENFFFKSINHVLLSLYFDEIFAVIIIIYFQLISPQL